MSTIQYIRSARKGKPITWYVYAYRGGPLIAKFVQPKKPKLSPTQAKHAAEAQEKIGKTDPKLFRSLIRAWRSEDPARKSSPEWDALAASTKRVWGSHLDMIDARWGDKPLSVWDDPRMKAKVVKWRNERAGTPRAADIGVTVLHALLQFGQLSGYVALNVASGIPSLYKGGDRAEIIWTDDDIERFKAAAKKKPEEEKDFRLHIVDGLRLCALTGLRRADLVSLTWKQIGEFAIVKTAMKRSRGKRRRATIPMTADLEVLLAELKTRPRAEGVETVLVNSFGRSWSGDGFGGSFNRVRDAANIVHVNEDGEIKKKHLHDVRGTFCTMLLTECELTDREAADIMAWSPERVAGIRKVYVDNSRVVVAIGERIAAKQIAKQRGGQ